MTKPCNISVLWLLLFLLVRTLPFVLGLGSSPWLAGRQPNVQITSSHSPLRARAAEREGSQNVTGLRSVTVRLDSTGGGDQQQETVVRFKETSTICETTPGVHSYAGYVDLGGSGVGGDEAHAFFWFFEARRTPDTAPVTLWLNGGPGSDSLVGLFEGCSCLSIC